MKPLPLFLHFLFAASATLLPVRGATIDTGTLLEESIDLARLARAADPSYRTVQFSSYDRRSTTSEAPGWFANADGFGNEPTPGFQKVLREPREGQAGLYLLAEVEGPGAIVRGWSAGMDGVLRVYLDPPTEGEGTLIYEGAAYGFLARRTAHYLERAKVAVDARDAFTQQDADYLPIPFARGLRVTWEGKLSDLHFYQLQVREYPKGTTVRSFAPQADLKTYEPQFRRAVAGLLKPEVAGEAAAVPLAAAIEPGQRWEWVSPGAGPGAIRNLRLRAQAASLDAALRGCLLRIAFDGSQRPQVEAPLGDFFGSGPGVNPFSSLPLSVEADGTLVCRFVMPFQKTARLELINHTPASVRIEGAVTLGAWTWDDRSFYFRAKWRVDQELLGGAGALDLPYLVAIGRGTWVGCAAMITNPSGVPTAGGNWWGEGDEKFLVDGELRPSTFGTGSEDYFNYSWSRPDLFAHPYCGQPLDSGPDTAGYVSNHRFQILDAIPFERSLAALLELWTHNRTPGLSYARVAYHYAQPGTIDDHRALMPSDLRISPLPARAPQALGAARGARFFSVDQLQPQLSVGQLATQPFPLASQLRVTRWQAAAGDRLKLRLPVEKAGRLAIHLVAVHRPDGATLRLRLDGQPLSTEAEPVRLRAAPASRVLNVNCKPVAVEAGTRELELECVESGVVDFDYLWLKQE